MLPLAIWAERFRFELLASCWNHSQSRQNDIWLQTSSSQWFRPQKGSKLQWIVWSLLELIQISHKIHLYEPLCWRGCWVVTSWYGSQWLRCGGGVGGADKNAYWCTAVLISRSTQRFEVDFEISWHEARNPPKLVSNKMLVQLYRVLLPNDCYELLDPRSYICWNESSRYIPPLRVKTCWRSQ